MHQKRSNLAISGGLFIFEFCPSEFLEKYFQPKRSPNSPAPVKKSKKSRPRGTPLMSCPKNRLLVLESLDISWDIICEFTNTKIPKEPWPHENKNGLGLIESRGWSAYDFYMPFSKPRSIYMAKIKREAEVTFLSLIFVIMVFGYVYKYVEFDFSFLYDFD